MLLSSTYLHFKPSQVAAAALLLSMNINGSECAQLMGAPNVLHDLHEKSVFYAENNGQEERKYNNCGPLAAWNEQVEAVTKLSATNDI